METDELDRIVREAERIGLALGLLDRAKAWTKLHESTKQTYDRVLRCRVETGMNAVSRESWRSTRAAIVTAASLQWALALTSQRETMKAEGLATAGEEARRALFFALLAKDALEADKPDQRSAPRRSKRAVLSRLPAEFQKSVYQAATDTQRPAVAVLWATGCRPAELEKGARVCLEEDCLVVELRGAKVTARTGHTWRRLYIDRRTAAGRALLEQLGQRTTMEVQRKAKRIANDFADIRARLGHGFEGLSPYCMRHAASADAKASDEMNPEEVAGMMGHVSTRTQSRYGTARQSKGGASAVTFVQTERPVRVREPTVPPSRPRISIRDALRAAEIQE
jgi:integrase